MGNNTKVLIVEDDSVMGMEMKELIETFGYEVVDVATSGESAVQSDERFKPALILMDVRLKGRLSGIETAVKIRQTKDLPILFLTGYKDDGTVDKIKAIPGTYILTKPVDFDLLERTMKNALS